MTFEDQAEAAAAAVGVQASVHAVDLEIHDEVGLEPDRPVVAASIFKLPVLVELCRQVDEGSIDPTARVRVPVGDRTPGGVGLAAMLDEVELSVRDTAYLMMSVSDNHATDIIIDMLGVDAVNARLDALGLSGTRLVSTCRDLFAQIEADIGQDVDDDALSRPDEALSRRLRAAAAFDPARTSATTPRETTTLLAAIWDDTAASPAACAEARRILGLQAWPHRLTAGFPDSRVKVAGKTGTMTYVRNEAGVVTYPDGGRYAVAVYLRHPDEELRNPDGDRLIGTLGRLAVDHLRHESS